MPTITAMVLDAAGQPDTTVWVFSSPVLRDGGTAIVDTDSVPVKPDETGLLTVDLLEGPCQVVHDKVTYQFTVPATDADLWDLIQAGAMMPPQTTDEQIQAAVDAWLEAHPPGGSGPDRTALMLAWNYNANTTPPPANNQFRFNNTDPAQASELYLSDLTVGGLSIDLLAPEMKTGDRVTIQDENDATKWHRFSLTGDSIDNGTYWTYPVVQEDGSGLFSASQKHVALLTKYWT